MLNKTIGVLIAALTLAAAPADLRIADAAMHSNRELVRTLVQQKADVNATQPDGTTALHWAVQHDDLQPLGQTFTWADILVCRIAADDPYQRWR